MQRHLYHLALTLRIYYKKNLHLPQVKLAILIPNYLLLKNKNGTPGTGYSVGTEYPVPNVPICNSGIASCAPKLSIFIKELLEDIKRVRNRINVLNDVREEFTK